MTISENDIENNGRREGRAITATDRLTFVGEAGSYEGSGSVDVHSFAGVVAQNAANGGGAKDEPHVAFPTVGHRSEAPVSILKRL